MFGDVSLSRFTGGFLGPTLPCQRKARDPDLLVRVVRADTGALVDRVRVTVSPKLTQDTGATGPGSTYFTDVPKGNYKVKLQFLTPAHVNLFQLPAAKAVKMVRHKRKTIEFRVEVTKRLDLVSCDHHFAPSREQIDIRYTIQGLSHCNPRLRVSRGDNNTRIYERALTAQEKTDDTYTIHWDGCGNHGSLSGKYINPLHAPYRLKIVCGDAPNNGTASHDLFVLYHRIVIEHGVWTADGQVPNKAAHPNAWAQYQLNELGYFAGPVDDVMGPQTERALRRYSYAAPGHYATPMPMDSIAHIGANRAAITRAAGLPNVEVGDVIRITAGPNANTDWQVYDVNVAGIVASVVGDAAPIPDAPGAGGLAATVALNETNDPAHAALDQHLSNDRFARLIFENDQLPSAGENVRAHLSHDHFYPTNADFLNPTGHVQNDQQKLDPIQFPVESSLQLVSRHDNDGTAEGVEVDPEAIGPVEIEWIVEDLSEDVSVLPPMAQPAAVPSRGRIYITNVLNATRHVGTGADNCPATNNAGGVRQAPQDNGDHFVIGAQHVPWTTVHAGTSVFSAVHQDAAACPDKLGRSGAWFKGSYIAGDRFKIKAQIAFARHGNQDLQGNHQTLANLTGRALTTISETETGSFTLWRTHHVAAVVNWPAPKGQPAPFDDVEAQYRMAHCRFKSEHESYDIGELIPVASRQSHLARINANLWAGLVNGSVPEFREDGVYPCTLPAQGNMTSQFYATALNNAVLPITTSAGTLDAIAMGISHAVRAREKAGVIVLRFDWHRPIFVRSGVSFRDRVNDAIWPHHYTTTNSCFGGLGGVVFLENAMCGDSGPYLFAHEMAHCRFLRHDEASNVAVSDNPGDHDTHDHNCIMSYPELIASRNPPNTPNALEWRAGGAEQPRFCGKCILKLRGWDPTNVVLPAHS